MQKRVKLHQDLLNSQLHFRLKKHGERSKWLEKSSSGSSRNKKLRMVNSRLEIYLKLPRNHLQLVKLRNLLTATTSKTKKRTIIEKSLTQITAATSYVAASKAHSSSKAKQLCKEASTKISKAAKKKK